MKNDPRICEWCKQVIPGADTQVPFQYTRRSFCNIRCSRQAQRAGVTLRMSRIDRKRKDAP